MNKCSLDMNGKPTEKSEHSDKLDADEAYTRANSSDEEDSPKQKNGQIQGKVGKNSGEKVGLINPGRCA